MADKFASLKEVKKKLNYIFRAYGVSIATKNKILEVLDKASAADVEPVKHGKWEQVDETKDRCSNCGTIYCIYSYPYTRNNYCPNCGARMDGGE